MGRHHGIPMRHEELDFLLALVVRCQQGEPTVRLSANDTSIVYRVERQVVPPLDEYPLVPPKEVCKLGEPDLNLLRNAVRIISALLSHIDFLDNVIADRVEESAVVADNERLRKALKPFADMGINVSPAKEDDEIYGREPTVGDLRAALAAFDSRITPEGERRV
jgi:hypothetical protein